MQAKKSVNTFIISVLSIIILFLSTLYIYDPLQIFHKPWGRETTFHTNMRQQTVGIINNYDFDSVILGTSMLQNTSSNEASELLKGKFINLSMSGSDFFERKMILKYLFRKKHIKKVIYSLDSDKFIYQIKGYKLYPLENFDYLYDKNPINDLTAYMNNKFLTCLIRFSDTTDCIGRKIELDRPGAWYMYKRHKVRYGGLDKWFMSKNNAQIKNAFKKISSTAIKIKTGKTISLKNINEKIDNAKQYINKNLLSIISSHPNTEFIIILPPYSRIYYSIWAQYNLPAYKIHQEIIRYLVQENIKFKNLKIYGFEDNALVDNINLYKDPKHYHYSINSWITKEISKGNNLLTISNIESYLDISRKKAEKFNLIGLGEKINTYLHDVKK